MEKSNRASELGKNRIEALSDGIFAVAMTLLVFEFHVPALPHTAANVVVVPALLQLWPKFLTYVVSFLSLGVFWIGHHNMYHAVQRADRVLLGLSIVFFLFVAFLPFSTSVLNAFLQTQAGLLFFGANLTILGWLLSLQWAYAASQPGMLADFVTPAHRALVRFRFLLYPVVVTLTMLLCFWSVPISLAIYLLLLPTYMIPGAARGPGSLASLPTRPVGVSRGPKRRTAGRPPRPRETPPTAPVGGPRWTRRQVVLTALGATAVIVGWAAFRPELLFVNRKVSEMFPGLGTAASPPPALLTGRFHGVAHQTHGVASLYQLPDGGRVLRLTDFQTSNGPDVRVYLIVAPDATNNDTVTNRGFIEVSRMKANEGDQNYPLPADLDLSRYHAVTIWCDRFRVNFATAPLSPP